MHNGLRVLYGRYYGSWVNEIISQLKGVHEPQEERVFYEVLKHIPAGATMVEAGCYWGYYSMWFARQVQDARGEPDLLGRGGQDGGHVDQGVVIDRGGALQVPVAPK